MLSVVRPAVEGDEANDKQHGVPFSGAETHTVARILVLCAEEEKHVIFCTQHQRPLANCSPYRHNTDHASVC